MKTKYILFIAFLILVAAQLYVPTSMILEQEDILETGRTFKFRTRPVDPNDPFRGKFVILGYQDTEFEIPDSVNLPYNEEVYVTLQQDAEGFAIINNVTTDQPESDIDYVKARISGANYYNDTTHIDVDYAFNRYYMEEYKAPEAEKVYSASQSDSLKTTWAVVKIKNGVAVLEDVMIDGESLVDIVIANQNK